MKNCSLRSRRRILRAKGKISRTRARILITQRRVEFFLLKHKNHKLWRGGENEPLQVTSKSAEQIKKSRKIASPQITAHIFWRFRKGNGPNHLIFQREFPVFQVNGKWPRPLPPPPPSAFSCSPHAIEKKNLPKHYLRLSRRLGTVSIFHQKQSINILLLFGSSRNTRGEAKCINPAAWKTRKSLTNYLCWLCPYSLV